MKEQDWPYRYENGCKINMVQIFRTVWLGTNYHGYTPTGSIPFARTPDQVQPLSQLYILRIIRSGHSSLSAGMIGMMITTSKHVSPFKEISPNNVLGTRSSC